MAAFAVNAALVASQRQHRAWTVSMQPPINAENEAGQAANKFIKFLVWHDRWNNQEANPASHTNFGGACSTNFSTSPVW